MILDSLLEMTLFMKLRARKNCRWILFMLLLSPGFRSAAQSVTGKWYGIGNVAVAGSANSYLCELILIQKGSRVTGYLNYFFRDGYFSNTISGTFNAKSHILKLNPIPILYYKTVTPGTGVDCNMQGEFLLTAAIAESSLAGSFNSDPFHVYTAPPVKIRFVKETKEQPSLKEQVAVVPVVKPVEIPVPKPENLAFRQLQMRRRELVRILDISDDSARVDLYDNGEFDYDSITVFYNNSVVAYKQLLRTRLPISFTVPVDSAENKNDLIMYAENLGLIPPNSALMVITDSQHRYEVNLESNYQKNAMVELRRIYPPALKSALK